MYYTCTIASIAHREHRGDRLALPTPFRATLFERRRSIVEPTSDESIRVPFTMIKRWWKDEERTSFSSHLISEQARSSLAWSRIALGEKP